MRRLCAVAILAGALLGPAAAFAHQGSPNMESVVDSVTPNVSGIALRVLNRDDRFELQNRSGKTITIEGYENEQYARMLANGVVQVNLNSPAYYLNEDRLGETPIPANAKRGAPVVWKTVEEGGRFQWHDHRMHYMGTGTPPGIKDKSQRQKIDDYSIPIKVGDQAGAIKGTLYWTPLPGGGPPVAAIAGLIVLVLAGGAFVAVQRRRRGAGGGGSGDDDAGSGPTAPREVTEAW